MEESKPNIAVGVDMSEFEGTYANSFSAYTNGMESRLDCIYIDLSSLSPECQDAQGKLVARVNMTTEQMVQLRDMLNEHIAKNVKGEADE